MNGIDAVCIAMGQDFRAVEAASHAFASRTGFIIIVILVGYFS